MGTPSVAPRLKSQQRPCPEVPLASLTVHKPGGVTFTGSDVGRLLALVEHMPGATSKGVGALTDAEESLILLGGVADLVAALAPHAEQPELPELSWEAGRVLEYMLRHVQARLYAVGAWRLTNECSAAATFVVTVPPADQPASAVQPATTGGR